MMIQVQGQLAGTVSLEFEALPLQQGLRRIFRDANALLVHTPATPEGGTPQILIRVWIFSQADTTTAAATAGREAPGLLDEPTDATPNEAKAQRELESAAEDAQDERLTALHAFHQQENIEALQQAVFDPDQTVQATALELLATQDRQVALDILVNATRSEQPTRRLQALSLLHQTDQAGDQTVLSALEEALADHDVTVKSYAIQVLAERGSADAIEALRQALRGPDVSMKKLIIERVAQTAQGYSLLQEALSDDNVTIRSLAAFWLEEATLKEKASEKNRAIRYAR
jgi:HEAT repeat protein